MHYWYLPPLDLRGEGYALCGGCSRESHKLVPDLVKILAEELYGYNVTLVYDDNWAVSILEGIRDDKVAFRPVTTRHRLSDIQLHS